MGCFDDNSSMQDSYTSGNFDTDYPSSNMYTFSSNVVIAGNTAYVISTKSDTGATEYDNTFVMAESDDEYYINTWTEDSTTIFFKKK